MQTARASRIPSFPLTLALAGLLLAAAPASVAGAACKSNAQCDDGLFCNGTEFCFLETCFPGTPVVCHDGVSCTIDLCLEEEDRCVSFAPDADGDGVRDASCRNANGVSLGTDCDDRDGNRFPGNREVCDAEAHDEDCDLTTFGVRDGDEDGHADGTCCNRQLIYHPIDGFVFDYICGPDCNDADPSVHPLATEACNGIDDNCRGGIDEGVSVALYADRDGDGHGAADEATSGCAGEPGFSTLSNDCDDDNPALRPGDMVCSGPSSVMLCTSDGVWSEQACPGNADVCVSQVNSRGMCLPLAAPVGSNDLDGDGVANASDNCPHGHNPDQRDSNQDGVGDACQCGDADGDGEITSIDARLIQRAAVGQIASEALVCGARAR